MTTNRDNKRWALRERATRRAILLFVIVALFGTANSATARDVREVLLGTWVRLQDRSDDLKDRLTEGGISVPGGSPSSGMTIGRQSISRPVSPSHDSPYSLDQIERMHKGVEALRIECVPSAISIRDANREIRWISTDGRTSIDGLGSRTTAKVVNEVLQIETLSFGSRRFDVIRVENEDLIVWSTTLKVGSQPSFTFLTVYERVGESAAICAEPGNAVADGVSQTPPSTQSKPTTVAETASERTDFHSPGSADVKASVIRILPPVERFNQLVSGQVLMQTLTIDEAIEEVEFWLDDERVKVRARPPFEAKIQFDSPPREQELTVRALDAKGRFLGDDRLVLNRLDPPFRVHISGIQRDSTSASLDFQLSVPRKAKLERVEVYYREKLVETLREIEIEPSRRDADVQIALTPASSQDEDFVRVLAILEDGRQLEDVEFLKSGIFIEKVDVQLVQLQVLVTDRSGRPVRGLTAEDFEIRDRGKPYPVERLYPAQDLALVLGLAIDSSGSMGPLWRQTREATTGFLNRTLKARDRAFLVDFDTQLRLLQPLTSDRQELDRALGLLSTSGGTALYDSILFSLLQYSGEPGRRALIVLTDGFDSASRADPKRAIEFGQRLGVPVYIIAMDSPGSRGGFANVNPGSEANAARNLLHLITDPTGGRLFQAGSPDLVAHAFTQIEQELRSQYILTYATDRNAEAEIDPRVTVRLKAAKVRLAIRSD